MPIDLSKVVWTASNIPAGLSFNTKTGTFTGTPTEAGEYTVPVSVDNGYGTDAKDVSIVVSGQTYPVYAVGSNAATWSNNAEADENGFRKLPMPDAYKLLQHYGGFGAKTESGDYYCCGVTGFLNSTRGEISSVLSSVSTPTKLTERDENVNEVSLLYLRIYTWTATSSNPIRKNTELYEGYCMLIRYGLNKLSCKGSNVRLYQTFESSGTTNTGWYRGSNDGYNSNGELPRTREIYKLPSPNFPTVKIDTAGVLWLENSGSEVWRAYFNTTDAKWYYSKSADLDYRALKVFLPYEKETAGTSKGYCTSTNSIFSYLSEDKRLDNNANNFTFGTIRDAWVYTTKAYVVTEDNNLYEKQGSGSWTAQGNYDVKKILLVSTANAFMLTNDGKLYHKGSAVSDVTDEHTEFTQIFPDYYFHDIAFDNGTLTVTKED